MDRFVPVLLVSAVVLGCGGPASTPTSPLGSFTLIEGAAAELSSRVLHPAYKGARDLGTDSDRVWMGLSAFMKEAEGGPHAEDAKVISEKMKSLDQMVSKRAPVAKQQEMAKELQAAIASLKAKL